MLSMGEIIGIGLTEKTRSYYCLLNFDTLIFDVLVSVTPITLLLPYSYLFCQLGLPYATKYRRL